MSRKSGSRTATRRSRSTASDIRRVWRIWPAMRPFAFEHGSDDLPFRFKLWLQKAFDLARGIADFAASTLARKKRELESSSKSFWPRDRMRSRPRTASQIGRARDRFLLLRLPRPGRSTQHLGAKTPPVRDPAKVTNGYRAHVGRRSRSRCANNRRHRKAHAPIASTSSSPPSPDRRPSRHRPQVRRGG